MRTQLILLYKILQQADEDIAFSTSKTTITYGDDNLPLPVSSKEVIDDADDIPESTTAMSKYFFGAYPNSKGGQI